MTDMIELTLSTVRKEFTLHDRAVELSEDSIRPIRDGNLRLTINREAILLRVIGQAPTPPKEGDRADLNLRGYRIRNLGAASDPSDAVNLATLNQRLAEALAGHTPDQPGGLSYFMAVQPQPEAVWDVPHQLGRYPAAVTTLNSEGEVEFGIVRYLDLNNVRVLFSEPMSGAVICS